MGNGEKGMGEEGVGKDKERRPSLFREKERGREGEGERDKLITFEQIGSIISEFAESRERLRI